MFILLYYLPNFVRGQGGCQILMYKNEKFVKNRKTDTRTYWICSKKNATICRARIVTGRDAYGLERIFQYNCKHNHTPKNLHSKLKTIRKDKKGFVISSVTSLNKINKKKNSKKINQP
ncbi:uncharacterized protein LOC135964312 [Calliphora vicina]|uniref:uncharacterized protein LOC135964312 n=1 Tax=Calliphora vicina TaxID=7373 RepID=UPI00325B93C7